MSTILKALRRLEEEKSRGGSQRPLREEVASGPGELQSRRRWTSWLPVLALVIGAGAGASAWWLWPYERTLGGAPELEPVAAAPRPDPKQTPPPVALQPAAPELPVAPVPQPSVAVPEPEPAFVAEAGPPEDAFASDVEVVQRPPPTPRIEPAPEPSVAAPPTPIPAAPPGPAVAPPVERVAEAKRAEAAARAARAREKKASAVAEPTPVARAPIDPPPPAVIVPAPAPQPAPAPAPVAPAAPPAQIYVTRTQWHPEPGRRSADVRVDGQSRSVHEGDVVQGYEVSEIKPSGVVLTRAGERLEQKIGQGAR